jgi:hypothetical protein
VGTWQARPESLGDRVARGLRGSHFGCASPRLLSPVEREACAERLAEAARNARPIEGTGVADRDAGFARQGRRALAEYEARRAPLAGGSGNVGPSDGVGSNFGTGTAGAHLDPSLRPDSTQNIRTPMREGRRAAGRPLVPGGGSPHDRQ